MLNLWLCISQKTPKVLMCCYGIDLRGNFLCSLTLLRWWNNFSCFFPTILYAKTFHFIYYNYLYLTQKIILYSTWNITTFIPIVVLTQIKKHVWTNVKQAIFQTRQKNTGGIENSLCVDSKHVFIETKIQAKLCGTFNVVQCCILLIQPLSTFWSKFSIFSQVLYFSLFRLKHPLWAFFHLPLEIELDD